MAFANISNSTNSSQIPLQCNVCDRFTEDNKQIAYAVFLAIVLLLSVIGNWLVCFAITYSPRLREAPTNIFIFSLSVSDMLYAVIQTPLRISSTLHNNAFCHNIHICRLIVFTDLILTPCTISTLFVISIDRFFCITSPFWYQENISKFTAKVIVGFVWLYSSIWAGISAFDWRSPGQTSIVIEGCRRCVNRNPYFYLTSYFVITLIPLVIMGILYVVILRVALVQIRAILATEVHLPRPDEDNKKDKKYNKMARGSRRTNRELKATATLAIVYGAFFICWMPNCIINIYIAFAGNGSFVKLRMEQKDLFLFIYYTFVEILPTLSTAINPIIYNVFNRQFRSAFASMMRICRKHDVLRNTTVVHELEMTQTKVSRIADHHN